MKGSPSHSKGRSARQRLSSSDSEEILIDLNQRTLEARDLGSFSRPNFHVSSRPFLVCTHTSHPYYTVHPELLSPEPPRHRSFSHLRKHVSLRLWDYHLSQRLSETLSESSLLDFRPTLHAPRYQILNQAKAMTRTIMRRCVLIAMTTLTRVSTKSGHLSHRKI